MPIVPSIYSSFNELAAVAAVELLWLLVAAISVTRACEAPMAEYCVGFGYGCDRRGDSHDILGTPILARRHADTGLNDQ